MGAFSGVRGCFGDVLVAFGFVWECLRFEKTEQSPIRDPPPTFFKFPNPQINKNYTLAANTYTK